MRRLSLVVLFAACSTNMQSTPEPVIDTTEMTCATTMKDYCAGTVCDQLLADAQKDKRLCPASELACGDYHIIMKADASTMTNFYYQNGTLVAIEHIGAQSQHDCLGGPASFVAQHCASTGRAISACASDPQPTGW
jgi:hypothetical protein